MTSWVYIFSKFTPEALLFEALVIFLLCCGYTAFWVLRKRRYGAVSTAVPSGPVKSYLNELIVNAEQLRLQLFGLLAASDHSASNLYRLIGLTPTGQPGGEAGADSDLAKKLAALEAKLLEQLKAMEALATEKARLERELAEARSKPAGDGSGQDAALLAAGKEDAGTIVRLQQRIQDLESKLAEYNVIEDDLANLKRLQQENLTLKSTLSAKGIAIPEADANVPVNWPTPTPSAPASSAPEPSAPTESANPSEAVGADAFASLAGDVESSLQQTQPPSGAAQPPADPGSSAPAPSSAATESPAGGSDPTQAAASENAGSADASTSPAPAKSDHEKSEADLVAEFERMLKG